MTVNIFIETEAAFAVADIVAIGLVVMSKNGKVAPFAIFMIAAPGLALAGAMLIYG